jgi:hypothetical protein
VRNKILLLLIPFVMHGAQASLSYEPGLTRESSRLIVSDSAPGSSLEFFDGVTPLGAALTGSQGQAVFPVKALTPGSHRINARVRGTGTPVGEVQVTVPGNASTHFSSAAGFALAVQPAAFCLGDINGDGLIDFISAGNGSISVLKGGPTGFGAAQIFPGVDAPTAILIGDFNGDGWNDVAVASESGQVAILLNNGNGLLTNPVFYYSGLHPSSLALADFNGDGIPDLVATNENGNDLSLFMGRNDGSFQTAVHFAAGSSPRSVVAADLNGDGLADLAVTDFSTNNVTVLLGDGLGGFSAASSVPTGSGPSLLLAGDFNEDGAVDLAVENELDNSVLLLMGNGTGGFSRGTTFSGSVSFGLGHAVGGAHLDLLIQTKDALDIMQGEGDGTFTLGAELAAPATPQVLLIADLNGDGQPDIAAADLSGVLSVFSGFAPQPTPATDASAPIEVVTTSRNTVAAARVGSPIHAFANGTSSSSVTLASSNTSSTLSQSITLTATVNPSSATGKVTFYDGTTIIGIQPVAVGQAVLTTALLPSGVNPLTARYSGDATYASSITASAVSQTVSALPQLGFTSSSDSSTLTTPANVISADVNGDGKPDLVVSNNSGTNISIFLNNGSGSFGAGTTCNVQATPGALVAVDLNADGIVDLAVLNPSAGTVTVLIGTATGTTCAALFPSSYAYSTGTPSSSPVAIATGDFNGDGIPDLVVANATDKTVSILLGNGTSILTLQTAVAYPLGTTPVSLAVADFNQDGYADVVALSNVSSSFIVLFGKANGTFSAGNPSPSTGTGASSIIAADLNGDGFPDLVVTNAIAFPTRNVGVFLFNNETGNFGSRVAYLAGAATGVKPYSVAVGYFTGQATPDLLVINNSGSSGSYSILPAAGAGTFGSATTTSFGSTPAYAAIADFNSDGHSDFAATSTSNDLLYVFLGIGQYPVLTASSAHSGSFTQGQTGATYILTVTNTSTLATFGQVSVVDSLPAGLTATAISGTNWNCTLATVTCTRNDSLQASQSYSPITVTVNVASNALQTVTNSVSVSGGGENAQTVPGTDPTTVLQTTSLVLTTSVNPATVGSSIALTATVNYANASSTTPTGTVVFYEGLTPIAAQPVVAGQAVLNTTLLSAGTHVITALYNGDAQYLSSASGSLVQTVNNQLQNGFQTGVNYLAGTSPSSITVADFNNDGIPDLAVANATVSNRVEFLLGNGNGTFQAAKPFGAGGNTNPAVIVAADFNGDGVMDAAVANYGSNTITVLTNNPSLLNNPNAAFTFSSPPTTVVTGANIQYLVAGDFNQDGKVDLAVADSGSSPGKIRILLGNGDGTFGTPSSVVVGNGPKSIVLGDFNADGLADLAVINSTDGTVSILLGTGNGSFQTPVTYTVGANPQAIAMGDFNGDGVLDLAVANSGANNITILLGGSTTPGVGNGTFQVVSAGPFPAGTAPNGIVTGDFNGDGILDLAVSNSAGASLLLGVGDGTFQNQLPYPLGAAAVGLVSADFNHDGLADLAVINSTNTSNVTVLLGGLNYSDPAIAASHIGNFTQGQTGAVYTLTVTNVGQYPTVGAVRVVDLLPVGITATAISGSGWTCVKASLTCTRSDSLVPLGVWPVINFTVNVSPNAGPQLTNTAFVSGGYENNMNNDTVLDPTTVIQNTTLSLVSSDPNWSYQESVTLIATVSSTAATGTVTFYQNSTALGTATLSNGIASVPGPSLAPGSYNFSAVYSGDSIYAGSTGTLSQVVYQATATVTLGNLNATYDGTQKVVSVVTNPSGLNVTLTYAGSSTPPSNAGAYAMLATVNDVNYTGSATGTLIIAKAAAQISLVAPTAVYNGNPQVATASTTPANLAMTITYGNGASAPVNVGTYGVSAKITDPNYTPATASGTIVITPEPVTITLSGFAFTYDGTAKAVTASVNPTGVPLTVTYNGSSTVPIAAGNYSITASPTSNNYSGSAAGTLVISQASVTFTLGNLAPIYNGAPQAVSVTSSPSGVAYSVKYNGSTTVPTLAGAYSSVVTATDPNYTGANSGTLTIQKATPVIVWPQPAAMNFGSALGGTQLNATSSTPGSFQYTPGSGAVLLPGSGQVLSALFTPSDTGDYNTATASAAITVNQPSSSGISLVITKILSRDVNNNIVINMVFANGGTVNAQNVILTSVKIGTTVGSPLPLSLGTIPVGQLGQATITVPGSAGGTGTLAVLSISGTYTGGSFSGSFRINLP